MKNQDFSCGRSTARNTAAVVTTHRPNTVGANTAASGPKLLRICQEVRVPATGETVTPPLATLMKLIRLSAATHSAAQTSTALGSRRMTRKPSKAAAVGEKAGKRS